MPKGETMTKQKVAIVGTGISGLTCAYLLQQKLDIHLYEANDYIGGHTHTVDINLHDQQYAIDTGFIVFNDWTYPNFIKFIDKLGVEKQKTEMSFSVKNTSSGLEYNGHNLDTLFAQRSNLMSPTFYRFVYEIAKFNKLCKQTSEINITLGEFLKQHKFSDMFAQNYILPMCAAIWSSSLHDVKSFPLPFFLRFFKNHGLLNITNRPQWYTLIGGSRAYISPMTKGFKDRIRLNCGVKSIEKSSNGFTLFDSTGNKEEFNQIILACHSDQALNMLASPPEKYSDILGKIQYAKNHVTLHSDTSLLPNRQKAWASWNYHLSENAKAQSLPATLTYNMNILQRIRSETTFCVTLNQPQEIAKEKILQEFVYAHPQFDTKMVAAQGKRKAICGVDGLHFCGAYWYNGFHEDGVRSALDVCKRFGASL